MGLLLLKKVDGDSLLPRMLPLNSCVNTGTYSSAFRLGVTEKRLQLDDLKVSCSEKQLSRFSCRVGADAGEARSPLSSTVRPAQPLALRAGGAVSLSACSSRSPSSVKGSSSAGSTSSGPGSGGSTLQEDLLKLIGPDYLDSDCEVWSVAT